jgi:hypothetical protein
MSPKLRVGIDALGRRFLPLRLASAYRSEHIVRSDEQKNAARLRSDAPLHEPR